MLQLKTLNQWLEWLEASHPTTDIELGLGRVSAVAKKLGLLKPDVPVITVAGTNGKGSVVATLESLAVNNKLNIGSYTSPHLVNFNERIKINGLPLSDKVICQAFEYIANNKGDTELTYFEFTTLVGLHCLSSSDLDFIALEVGLGGRLDAVNIVDADVSIVTSIGLDHMDWLGDTLEAIAFEKAGIARKDKPLIVADKHILPLLKKAIEQIKPKVISEEQNYQLVVNSDNWSYNSSKTSLNNISKSSLFKKNQAAALTAFIEIFPEKNNSSLLVKSLEEASLIGRFSTLSKQPHIILDVAHNPDSAALLNSNVKNMKLQDSTKIWAICGMLKDKDIEASLTKVTEVNYWLCLDLPKPRGAQAEHLLELLSKKRSKSLLHSFENISNAYQYFSQNAKKADILLVFGSFVTVGQMLEYWQSFQN